MRLLYVEDNRINALLFEEAMKLVPSIDLRIAEDGDHALAQAAGWHPDVLVLDSHLPDISGTELLPRLRALTGLADTPAFMCSADAQPDDIRRAIDAGFRGYWPKPLMIVDILRDLEGLGT